MKRNSPRRTKTQKEIDYTLAILNRPDRHMNRGEVLTIRFAIDKAKQYGLLKGGDGIWYDPGQPER